MTLLADLIIAVLVANVVFFAVLLWRYAASKAADRVFAALLVTVAVVGGTALWRSTNENRAQPHVPTKFGMR